MEANILLTLFFSGVLPVVLIPIGIKAYGVYKKKKAALAMTRFVLPGGFQKDDLIKTGVSILTNKPKPVDVSNSQNPDTKEKKDHSIRRHRTPINNNVQDININETNLENEKDKNKRKGGLLSGVGKAVGGALYMSAELGKKGAAYAGGELKGTVKEMYDIMGVSRGIKKAKRFMGKKVFKPAKRIVSEKIWQPAKETMGKIYNSRPITGVRGVVRKTGEGIVTGFNTTMNTINSGVNTVKDKYNNLMEWKKRITDPEQSPLIQRVNSIIENGAKLRGRIEKYADDNTNGYAIMQEGIEEIKAAREKRKEEKVEKKEEREAKKKEKKEQRKAKKEEEKANGTNIFTRVVQKFRPQAKYTAVPQQVVILNNPNTASKTEVKVNITDANLNNLYSLNNTHYKVVVNPLKGTEGLLQALNDPKNFGMSAKQIMTYQIAKSRITERESDYGSKLPEGYYLEEKLRYLKRVIKMAPGLTADQAALVTEKAIEKKIKNEDEKRKKSIYAAYNNRNFVVENRKVIENILKENPTFENQLMPFIEESYENVQLSPQRTEEIQAQVNQYYSGQIQDFGGLMTSKEIEIVKSNMGSSSPEEQAKVIEEELFKREKKNIRREEILDEISQNPNGVISHTVFSSDDFHEELTAKIRENDEKFKNEVGKAIELDRQNRIEQIKKEEGVTLYEAAYKVEAQEQEHYIKEAIKEVAPKVEIIQTQSQTKYVSEQSKPQSKPQLKIVNSKQEENNTTIHEAENQEPIKAYVSEQAKTQSKPQLKIVNSKQEENNTTKHKAKNQKNQEPNGQPVNEKSEHRSQPLSFAKYVAEVESRKKKLSPTGPNNNEKDSVARQPLQFEEYAAQAQKRKEESTEPKGQSKSSRRPLTIPPQESDKPSLSNRRIGEGKDPRSISERNRQNRGKFGNAG